MYHVSTHSQIYISTFSRTCIIGVRAPPMILQNLFFYKACLILFKIKEGPQSISIAKVDFGAIFKMAASENIIYLILIFIHHIESRNTMGTLLYIYI